MNIIFDMDGVIINPAESEVNRVKEVCEKYNLSYKNKNLKRYIGYDIREVYYDLTKDKDLVEECAKMHIELFWQRPIEEAVPYNDIERVFQELLMKGNILYIVTGRPLNAAVQLMNHYGFTQYFSEICTCNERDKGEVIDWLMNKYEMYEEETYMVGDREIDITAANHNSITSIGVLWGFANIIELREAGCFNFYLNLLHSIGQINNLY